MFECGYSCDIYERAIQVIYERAIQVIAVVNMIDVFSKNITYTSKSKSILVRFQCTVCVSSGEMRSHGQVLKFRWISYQFDRSLLHDIFHLLLLSILLSKTLLHFLDQTNLLVQMCRICGTDADVLDEHDFRKFGSNLILNRVRVSGFCLNRLGWGVEIDSKKHRTITLTLADTFDRGDVKGYGYTVDR